MLNLNSSTLSAVVDKAMRDAADHPRWLSAINRAVVEILSNPWIERGDHGLIIASPSGKCYAANGVCQCLAFEHGQPCWHRAAARLVRLHDERETTLAADTIAAVLERNGIAPDVEQVTRSVADRIAAQRKAQAEMDALFA